MSILENKQFHGLPGLGATGQRGATGAEGSSILFGYIEDFFELEEVHIDEFVRYASRGSGDTLEYFQDIPSQYIINYVAYLVKGQVFSSPTSSTLSETIKLSEGPTTIKIPTIFSNLKSKPGDILYIIEDDAEKGKVIRYMIITEELMYGQSFYSIINNYIILTDPTLIKSFYLNENNRLSISEMYSPIRYEVPALMANSTKQKYIQNFIKATSKKDYVRMVSEYSSDDITNFESDETPNSSLGISAFSGEFWMFSDQGLKVPAVFLNNDCLADVDLDNVIMPQEINFINGSYLRAVSENDFDITTGNIKILFSQFFNIVSSITEYNYGALVSKIPKNSSVDFNEVLDYDFGNASMSYIDLMSLSEVGENKFKIYLYLSKDNTTTYYSKPSIITVNKSYIEKFDRYVIDSYTVEDGDQYVSDDVESGDTEYVDFTLDALSSEKTEDIKFKVAVREGYYIESISFNGIPVFKNDSDDISEFDESSGYWMSISNVSGIEDGDNSSSKIYTLGFQDNLPNLSSAGINPSSLNEYLSAFGKDEAKNDDSILFHYLVNNISTLSRSLLVTVVTRASKDSAPQKSYYKIIQPGFLDSRNKPKVTFNSRIYNNDLEKSNNVDKGVLCNQLQYFVDVNIEGFNQSTWGKYKKDAKIDLYFAFDRFNKEKSEYSGNLIYNNNLLIYDKEFLDSFKNNAVRFKVEYIKDKNITIESSDNDIINSEGYHKFDTAIHRAQSAEIKPTELVIDGSTYTTDWVYLNDQDTLEYDFNFKNNEGVIKDIPCALNAGTINHKIRISIEFANPIPSEMNLDIVLDKAVMHYEVDGQETYFTAIYHSNVEMSGGSYTDYSYKTGNAKFIFNPVYFTVAPTADEDLVSLSFKPALKKCTGSIKETNLGFGLFGYDSMKTKANKETEYERLTKFFNYKDFFVKIQDFQDNIKSVYLNPRNIKDNTVQDSINKNNDFKSLIEILKDENAVQFGFETFEDDSRVNTFDESSYLSLVYNSNILLPKTEAEESIITYNDKEYDGNNYAQYANNAPIFLRQGFSLQIRSDEEINAISGWNYEYESSKYFNQNFVIGGSSTISGNGYLKLPKGYGTDKYDEEEIVPLDELLLEQNQEVFSEQKYLDILQYSSVSNKFIPKDENYWRVPVWNFSWMVPVYKYDKVNNLNYIVPFRFTNPYLMFLDKVVTEQLIAGKDYSDIIIDLGYITGSYQMSQYISDFLETDGKAIYINAKYNNYNCIKLLDVLTKTNYTSASIDDYNVSKIVDAISEVTDKYDEEISKYSTTSDIPDNIIRWWKCEVALTEAQANPTEYDTNLSLSQLKTFKEEFLDIAFYDTTVVESPNKKFNLEYYEKYTKKEGGETSRNNFIPYNLLYSIYPRIIYPEDKNRVNVLMVQQPTISSEYDYKLTKHYFSTLNYIDLYPDLPEPYQCLL